MLHLRTWQYFFSCISSCIAIVVCSLLPAVADALDNSELYYPRGVSIFVKKDSTPLRSTPSLNSPVVTYVDRTSISRGNIISPLRIPKGGIDQNLWIQVGPGDVGERGGWLLRKDVLTPDEFEPVKIWSIKTYSRDFGDSELLFRFTPDGHVKMLSTRYGDPEKIGKWISYGVILHKNGILLLPQWGNFAFYDEKNKIICDIPINASILSRKSQEYCRDRTTYFTDAEIKAYLKAKAEGRPLPKIAYGHVGP